MTMHWHSELTCFTETRMERCNLGSTLMLFLHLGKKAAAASQSQRTSPEVGRPLGYYPNFLLSQPFQQLCVSTVFE